MIGVPPAETARTKLGRRGLGSPYRMHKLVGSCVGRRPERKSRKVSVVIGATAILVVAGLVPSLIYDLPRPVRSVCDKPTGICTVSIAVWALSGGALGTARAEDDQCCWRGLTGLFQRGLVGGW